MAPQVLTTGTLSTRLEADSVAPFIGPRSVYP